ncbi:ABC transporter permease [candidate division KSB1 bacterium]
MSPFRFLIQFLRDIKAQKLRTTLTMFGIVWGTVAVVLLLAFGEGLYNIALEGMRGMGERIVVVFPQQTTLPYEGLGIGRPIRLKPEDAWALEREIPEIEAITPEYAQGGLKYKYKKNTTNISVSGVYPVYADLRNIQPQPGGRFISQNDVQKKRRIIFIGNELKDETFGDEDAIGQRITLNGLPFVVIGVLVDKVQNSSYGSRDEDKGFIPASTLSSIYGLRYINYLLYRPKPEFSSKDVTKRVYQVLGKRLRFDPEDKDALFTLDTAEFEKILFYFFLVINLLLGIGGGCTMVVGGIGVANIMYVVIRERIGEIGIKMAVGAKPGHIMTQFFIETILIIIIGGLMGFGISALVVKVFSYLPLTEYVGTPKVSLFVSSVTALVLGIIAFIAGYFPAKRAAGMHPVQALALGKFQA